jgi:phosphoribosylformylglycinamidine synthase subunit PurS
VKARVTVYPRREVLDPQGKAVHQAIARLGFEGVSEVRVGKSFDIDLAAAGAAEAREQLQAICRKLLVNEIMEDFEIELLAEEPAPGATP